VKVYKIIHFLSLDIVLGALAVSCFAARMFGSSPGWSWWAALAISVWILYMVDHLIDTWRYRKKSKREIHTYLMKRYWFMLGLLGLAIIMDSVLILNFMERSLTKAILALGGLVFLFYAFRHIFRRNRLLFIPGETFVLLFYLAGTWMGPFLTRGELDLQADHLLILIMMAGVLLMNLGIISLYDVGLDSRLGISTLARTFGQKSTRNLLFATALIVILLSLMQFMVGDTGRTTGFALILAGMTLLYLLILFLPAVFRKNDAFRLVSDAILYMCFLSLLVS